MAQQMKESDWKVFRDVRVQALDHYCESILAEIGKTSADEDARAHARYTAVWRLMEDRLLDQ